MEVGGCPSGLRPPGALERLAGFPPSSSARPANPPRTAGAISMAQMEFVDLRNVTSHPQFSADSLAARWN
jgi:hypothetical protein